jgi:sugar lactone lactonase YvrE
MKKLFTSILFVAALLIKYSASCQTITTFLNSGLSNPYALAFDASGNLYVSNQSANTILKVTGSGSVSTFVSSGLSGPSGIAFDASGNLYVANYNGGFSSTIKKITSDGTVSAFASSFSGTLGIAFDASGNLYIANRGTNSISKITSGGSASTFVSSSLNRPASLAFDASGNLYVSNRAANSIVKITSSGSTSTFVSSGLNAPQGLAFDASGNLYVANNGNSTISKVTGAGTVSTYISSGLSSPQGLAFDASGNLFVSSSSNNTIVKITEAVLSVELLNFEVHPIGNMVELSWETANEVNNKGFQIERQSAKGDGWETLGFIKSKGKAARYHFTDIPPLSIAYYRLRQIDNNGKETLSKIISAQKDIGRDFKIYPNPKNKDTPLSIQTTWTESYTFNLYDATGKRIYTRDCQGSLTLPHLDLTSGLYFYQCNMAQSKASGKIIVL